MQHAIACGRGNAVTVEQAAAMRARRVGSRMDGETTAIREEGESGDFLFFYFRADGSVACWAVRASRPTNARLDETEALPTALSNLICWVWIHQAANRRTINQSELIITKAIAEVLSVRPKPGFVFSLLGEKKNCCSVYEIRCSQYLFYHDLTSD